MDKYTKLLNKIEGLRSENEQMIENYGGVSLDSYEAGYEAALYAVKKEAENIERCEKVFADHEKLNWVKKNHLWLVQHGWIEKERLVWAIEKQMAKKDKKATEIKVDMIPCLTADEKVCEAVKKLMDM